MNVPTQTELIQRIVFRLTLEAGKEPIVEVGETLDEALRVDLEEHDGQVFHEGQTPRNSARRALYKAIDTNVLIIKDGHGYVRLRTDALRDVVLRGDAWEILKLIPSESIGCIIADGPNTSLDEHRNVGKATRITNGQYFKTRDYDEALLKEFYRVLTPGSYCFLYMAPRQASSTHIWDAVPPAARAAGFVELRCPTWNKMRRGMGYRFTMQTEPILVLAKLFRNGDLPACHDRTVTDMWNVPSVRGNQRTPYTDFGPVQAQAWKDAEAKYGGRGEIPREVRKALPGQYHETEKPVDLAHLMLRVAKKPGEILLDCFAGSGHAAMASHDHGMSYLCVEYNDRAVRHLLAPRLRSAGLPVNRIIEVQGAGA